MSSHVVVTSNSLTLKRHERLASFCKVSEVVDSTCEYMGEWETSCRVDMTCGSEITDMC